MKILSELKRLPRENWVLFFSMLINRMGMMALFFLVLYLHHQLNYSNTQAGFILGCYGAGAIIGGQIGGWLCDRFGAIKTIAYSLMFAGFILVLFPLAKSFGLILLLTLLWAIAAESFRPANLSAVSLFCNQEQKKIAFALNRMGVNLGVSVGPAIGGLVVHHSFFAVFLIDGITTIIAAMITLLFLRKHFSNGQTIAARPKQRLSMIQPLKDKKMILVMSAVLLIFIVFYQHVATLPIYIVQIVNLNTSVYGFLISLSTIMIVLFELPLNIFINHWPNKLCLVLGSFLMALGFGLLSMATHIETLIVCVVIWTIGEMFWFPGITAYISKIATSENKGSYMGLLITTMNAAMMLGSWFGILLLTISAQLLWGLCFFIGLVSVYLFTRLA